MIGYKYGYYIKNIVIPPTSISVTSVSITPSTFEGNIGNTVELSAIFSPTNATNKTGVWNSDDELVATVSQLGLVTLVGEGTCTITFTSNDGSFTDTCDITSNVISVTSVELSSSQLEEEIGTIVEISANVLPSNATNKTLIWSSDDEDVATIAPIGNSNISITFVGEGTCTITVETVDGGYTDTCDITSNAVPVSVTSISVSPDVFEGNINDTIQLTETVLPSNATNKIVAWYSSNENIATVSSSGLVTLIAIGTCNIIVETIDGGFTDICSIICSAVSVTSVSLNYITFEGNVDDTLQLVATVLPTDAGDKSVSWISNNETIATVSSNGLVTIIGDGICNVTVITIDGGFTDICQVIGSTYIVDKSQEKWSSAELDAWLINNADTYTNKLIRLPNINRTYLSDDAYTTLTENNDAIEYYGQRIPEDDTTPISADEFLAYLVAQGDSETGAEGDSYWNQNWGAELLIGRTSASNNDYIILTNDRGNSFI